MALNMPVLDTRDRPLGDLRISVTDRCNFRCTYCMPREIFGSDFPFLSANDVLNYDEIDRVARIFVGLGVRKIRLTGGEPLVRRDIEALVRRLAAIPGLEDLTITTNGSQLAKMAKPLHDAGLKRLTVSLDALDDAVFQAMNDAGCTVSRVLDGIAAAQEAGIAPIKVNAVIKRGVNEGEVLPLARRFHGAGCILRFIEFMDVGGTNGWQLDQVVSAQEIIRAISAEMPLEPMEPQYLGEVARRYRYRDGGGEIGVIASVTQPFCGACTRLRLSADGNLYTCLFASGGHDLKSLLRGKASDDEIASFVTGLWRARADNYSETRSFRSFLIPKVEMSRIGG